jgi:hypothetical protein
VRTPSELPPAVRTPSELPPAVRTPSELPSAVRTPAELPPPEVEVLAVLPPPVRPSAVLQPEERHVTPPLQDEEVADVPEPPPPGTHRAQGHDAEVDEGSDRQVPPVPPPPVPQRGGKKEKLSYFNISRIEHWLSLSEYVSLTHIFTFEIDVNFAPYFVRKSSSYFNKLNQFQLFNVNYLQRIYIPIVKCNEMFSSKLICYPSMDVLMSFVLRTSRHYTYFYKT